jgi:NDP-sugar pyrophosphorylase family protein
LAIIGVIPAAGHATRLQPLDLSKEVYPIGGRPVMDYLVERMLAAGCDELRVVTRPDKHDVAENARAHGATVVEGQPASPGESFLLGIRGVDEDAVVLLGYPDSIWEPVDGYAQILPLLDAGWEVALGLFEPDAVDLHRYETVLLDEASGRVRGIEFKVERPSSRWIWGCAVARAGLLRGLVGQEEPGRYFHSLCTRGTVGSMRLSDCYIDVGTPDGLRRALSLATGGRANLQPPTVASPRFDTQGTVDPDLP